MLIKKFQKILERYEFLSEFLSGNTEFSDETIKLSKEYSDMKKIAENIKQYNSMLEEKSELLDFLSNEKHDEIMEINLKEDIKNLSNQISLLENRIRVSLLPEDLMDKKNAIIEVRAGTGGVEASIFASELFAMYIKYSALKKWKCEILSITYAEGQGYKEATVLISGISVFSRLKFESGVHRVQRVPDTESSGRLHTSAATVAVLPEVEDIDVQILDSDLKIETYRASGAGGQHVNTTDSAVRITHIPTSIVVAQQDEKSQHQNKAKALKILKARVYDAKKAKSDQERANVRKTQIGSGDRSERIRTYNFPQGRITDHRINLTLYKINEIFKEGELDEMIDALIQENIASKLSQED
ncbi:MAG: peptide chain release factor 1 [Rickettsia sp.]|nr:peptide chain release factor 1 [Rickettsia sp.]